MAAVLAGSCKVRGRARGSRIQLGDEMALDRQTMDGVIELAGSRGLRWRDLSFDQRAEVIRDYRANLPKPLPVKPPLREAFGSTVAISGGVGLPLGDKVLKSVPSRSEGWRDHVGNADDPLGRGAARFDYPTTGSW
jgi:hypothetical protein